MNDIGNKNALHLKKCRAFRIIKRWCRDPESNWGHVDFQSTALPTELSRLFSGPHYYEDGRVCQDNGLTEYVILS